MDRPLDYATPVKRPRWRAVHIVGFTLCALWGAFWLLMAVMMFLMRGMGDEPGRPAGVGFGLVFAAFPAAIGAAGILGCWKIEKEVRRVRRR